MHGAHISRSGAELGSFTGQCLARSKTGWLTVLRCYRQDRAEGVGRRLTSEDLPQPGPRDGEGEFALKVKRPSGLFRVSRRWGTRARRGGLS
jgi:hypothetical protein